MKNRADDIRRRYEDRIKQNKPIGDSAYVSSESKGHPLFNFPFFITQLMLAICLFLTTGILFKNDGVRAQKAQVFIRGVFDNEFQFASVKTWYEKQFGKPLALLPDIKDNTVENKSGNSMFAVPANGKVYESFETNGKGILIKTGKGQPVETAKEGYVVFEGDKGTLGKTIIIQHGDNEESWYGMLDTINPAIKLYSYIKSGTVIGSVSVSKDKKSGTFYFAIKKNNQFIDPSKVIPFE